MSALKNDKFMRVLLMFDVPTKTKKEQKYATKFRNELIKLGFFMMQFSVYMRICKGISSAKSVVTNVKMILPPFGNVRALIITEKQFDNMQILLGSAGFNERVNDDKNVSLFEFDEKIGDYRYTNDGLSGQSEGEESENTENMVFGDKNKRDKSEKIVLRNESSYDEGKNSAFDDESRQENTENKSLNDKNVPQGKTNANGVKKKKADEPSLFEF